MRRAFVAQDYAASCILFPMGLAEDQLVNLPAKTGNFAILDRNHIGQIVDDAAQMCDFLFQGLHGAVLHRCAVENKGMPTCVLGSLVNAQAQ